MEYHKAKVTVGESGSPKRARCQAPGDHSWGRLRSQPQSRRAGRAGSGRRPTPGCRGVSCSVRSGVEGRGGLAWHPQGSGTWRSKSTHLQNKSRRVSGRKRAPGIFQRLFRFASGYATEEIWDKSWRKEQGSQLLLRRGRGLEQEDVTRPADTAGKGVFWRQDRGEMTSQRPTLPKCRLFGSWHGPGAEPAEGESPPKRREVQKAATPPVL